MSRFQLGTLLALAAFAVAVFVAPALRESVAGEPVADEPLRPRPALSFRVGELGRIVGTVADADGTPVAGARCVLTPSSAPWTFEPGDTAGAAPISTTTDDNGRFRFEAPDGFWLLEVFADGFCRWRLDHLAPGEDRAVRLRPETALEIVVRDRSGRPVPNARVEQLADFRQLDRPPLAAGTTDEAGRVTLTAITPGDNYLALVSRDHGYHVEVVELDDGVGPRPVELAAVPGLALHGQVRIAGEESLRSTRPRVRVEAYSRGQSLALDLACDGRGRYATEALFAPGETVRVMASAPGFAGVETWTLLPTDPHAPGKPVDLVLDEREQLARGRAVDANGEALSEVGVYLASIEPIGQGQGALVQGLMQVPRYPERWIRVATTDADGHFEVGRLGGGRQHVLALSGPAGTTLGPAFAWVPLREPGAASELGDVELRRCGELWGVLGHPDGSPLADAAVGAHLELIVPGAELDSWRPETWWRPLYCTTRSDGWFRFPQLAPGSYDLKVGGQLLANRQVAAGSSVGPVEIVVARAPESPIRRISGRVTDPVGAPLARAFVGLFDRDAESDDDPISMTFTAVDGSYELSAPVGRTYELRVSEMRGRFLDAAVPVDDRFVGGIELAPDPARRDPLVVVVLDPDGLPLEGIDVLLEPPENAYCGCISFGAKSDVTGLVTFEPIAAKDHRVIVSDPLGRWAAKDHRRAGPGDYIEVLLGD